MQSGDTKLAQAIYLANMYAQRGECQCMSCQLLRQATDGMIHAFLGGTQPGTGLDMAAMMKQMGVGDPAQKITIEEPST